MAMHTGMATSKVFFLVVGAGVTGQMILGKTRISELIANIQEALKESKEKGKGDEGMNMDVDAIQAQIWRLTQEMKQLYGGRQITVVNEGASHDSKWPSLIVPIVVVGSAGYCYMWWKGWSFSDMMYVTKRNMANAVSNVTKQLEHVTEALAATKRHLTQRLEKLNGKMDEQKEITMAIKNEVVEVREDLSKMGLDIEAVQRLVEGLELKIDSLDGKQEITNAGVVYLCRFVQGLAGGGQKLELLEAQSSAKPRPFSGGDSGLKGLQCLTDALTGMKGGFNSGKDSPDNGDTIPGMKAPLQPVRRMSNRFVSQFSISQYE